MHAPRTRSSALVLRSIVPDARVLGVWLPLPLAVLLATPGGYPESDLRFAPEDGAGWERTFEERTTWLLDDVEMRLDGDPMPIDLPEIESTLERTAVLGAEVEMAEGERVRERRLFDELEGRYRMAFTLGGQQAEFEFEQESPLTNATVVFAADGDGELRAQWPEGEDRSDRLLEALAPDADLQGLLPEEEVEEGDSWSPEPAALAGLLAPSGGLGFVPSTDPGGDINVPVQALIGAGMLSFLDFGAAEIDGELQVTWRETVRSEGSVQAALVVEFQGTLEGERAEEFASALEELGELEGEQAFEYGFDLEVEGLVLWDLERNLPRTSVLEVEFGAESRLAWAENTGGGVTQFDAGFEISGTAELRGAWEGE